MVSKLWVHELLHKFLQIYARSLLKRGQLLPQTINYVKKFLKPKRFWLKSRFHWAIDLGKLRSDSPWSCVQVRLLASMLFQQKPLFSKIVNWWLLLYFSFNWNNVSDPKQNSQNINFLEARRFVVFWPTDDTQRRHRRGRFLFCKKLKSQLLSISLLNYLSKIVIIAICEWYKCKTWSWNKRKAKNFS